MMADEIHINELLLNITTQLAKLQATVETKLQEHDRRLDDLEKDKKQGARQGEYGYIVPWLIKGMLVALSIIATSAGAGGILKSIFGL